MDDDQEVVSDEGIPCPYCGNVHSDMEDYAEHVSFWGSDGGRKQYECLFCDKIFEVKEQVSRVWVSYGIEE